jgi:hypothetical protein
LRAASVSNRSSATRIRSGQSPSQTKKACSISANAIPIAAS